MEPSWALLSAATAAPAGSRNVENVEIVENSGAFANQEVEIVEFVEYSSKEKMK